MPKYILPGNIHWNTTQSDQTDSKRSFGWMLESYVLATSKVMLGRAPTCDSAQTHGDFIVLIHWVIRLPAWWRSHIILTLS